MAEFADSTMSEVHVFNAGLRLIYQLAYANSYAKVLSELDIGANMCDVILSL